MENSSAENKKSSLTDMMIFIGFVLQLSGQAMKLAQSSSITSIGPYITWLGAIIIIWACVRLAISKGYSGLFGLLGILSMVGVIILFCLPQNNQISNAQNAYAKSVKVLGAIYGFFGMAILILAPIIFYYAKISTPIMQTMLPASLLRAALFVCVAWCAWQRPSLSAPFAWASLVVFILSNLYQTYIQIGQLTLHGLITTFYIVVILQLIGAVAFNLLTPKIGNANVA